MNSDTPKPEPHNLKGNLLLNKDALDNLKSAIRKVKGEAEPEPPVIEPWMLDASRSITRLNTNDPEKIAQSIAWYYAPERARLRRELEEMAKKWRSYDSQDGMDYCADEIDALIDRELPERK